MSEIKAGDLVRLKSGGPEMTVEEKMAGGGFMCKWFVGEELKKGVFKVDALEVITEEDLEAPFVVV